MAQLRQDYEKNEELLALLDELNQGGKTK